MKTLDNLMQRVKAQQIVCIIPTLNEVFTIADVVQKAKRIVHRVVVVDGYSSDGTPEQAFNAGADVLFQEGEGKGMALRTAFNKIYGDIYVTIDGDGTYDVQEMGSLLQPLLDGEADMVVGSRLAGRMEEGSISLINRIGNRLFNFLINMLFNSEVTDSQSGFRAIHRYVVDKLNLTSEGFEVETEITIKALKQGVRIAEVPISYRVRRGSASKLSFYKAGFRIFQTIFRASFPRLR